MIIEQRPLYNTLPVGQDIIFTVSNNTIVANNYNVKFTAQVYVAQDVSDLSLSSSLVATLKVTPNNAGVGIFSLNPILESYVSPQHQGTNFDNVIYSTYKGTSYSDDNPHPIHLIDKYSNNRNNTRYFSISFNIEYFTSATSTTPVSFAKPIRSEQYLIFNGVLDYDDVLQSTDGNFGYNLNKDKLVLNDSYGELGKFLSNAPIIQDARLTDYGTLSFLNFLNVSTNGFQVGTDSATINMVSYILIFLYNSSGVQLGTAIQVDSTIANGGYNNNNDFSQTRLMYFGGFPANLDGWSTDWDTHKANVSYYTIQAFDDADEDISQLYRINIITDACKGFEAIRLTWLNQYGTWDYYTFKKKSIKSLQTNRTSYTQLGGTWNEKKFKMYGYKGGKKNFRVNTKQLITVNTDFVNESEAVWFENLINSTDVYMLNGYDSSASDTNFGITNKYVEPITVTTSSYTRKTKANDKLIQYTFQIEKTHNKRTHSV
tara:strand:+ start:584 stop:2044 length:1461 start_codon:yes stop_codon:yes gene_type:complete